MRPAHPKRSTIRSDFHLPLDSVGDFPPIAPAGPTRPKARKAQKRRLVRNNFV